MAIAVQTTGWQHPSFHLDVAHGAAGGFSLEELEDTSRPRRGDPPR